MSKAKLDIREVSPMLQVVRNILLGRKHTLALRWEKDLVTRSPPPPVLPDGPSHLLAANYYCSRDARREVKPPQQLISQKLIGKCEGEKLKIPTPGIVHRWD